MRSSSTPMNIQLVVASLEIMTPEIWRLVRFVYWLAMPAFFIGVSLHLDATLIMIEALITTEMTLYLMIANLCLLLVLFIGFPLGVTYAFEDEVVGFITKSVVVKTGCDYMDKLAGR